MTIGAIVFCLLATIVPISAASIEIPDSPVVSTLAGSGAVGIADGAGASATFVSPTGLSFGRDGTLYVADRDAQRIRSISSTGVVRTIAGGAPLAELGTGAEGDYRDGPALQARFNLPSAVLALDDGSILVADTENQCIRRIKDGVVSTVAGDRRQGKRDGVGSAAEFSLPVSLAKDRDGNVYVADPPNGIRKVDRRGAVTTLNVPGTTSIVALSAVPSHPNQLLVASSTNVERLDLKTSTVDRPFPLQLTYDYGGPYGQNTLHEGLSYFGPAAAIAAFSGYDFVYADPLSSAVRMGQTQLEASEVWDYSRVLTAAPSESAATTGGAFFDGPGTAARVDEPMGIAISPNGTIALADTGNRRIRILSPYNHRTHVFAHETGSELPTKPDASEYRIALVGDSYVWWNQSWHDSIAGIAQDALPERLDDGRRPVIYPVMRSGMSFVPALSLIDNELSDGLVDMVVLDLPTYGQMGGDRRAGAAFPAGWQQLMTTGLARTKANLERSGVALLVLDHPGAADFPGESEYLHVYKGGDVTAYPTTADHVQSYRDAIESALKSAGVTTLDLWPAFLESYRASNRTPLFAAWDYHLSPAGRTLIGANLARSLRALHPWSAPRPASK